MSTIKDAEVQKQIQAGLAAFRKLAKARLKPKWKSLPWREKVSAARSLVFMDNVAHNPSKYLSREQTEAAWEARALEYAAQYDLKDYRIAYCIVQDPRGIVWYSAIDALQRPLADKYYHFLGSIQGYEYAKPYEKERYAKQIEKYSKNVCEIVDILESKPIIKQWKLLKRHFTLSR